MAGGVFSSALLNGMTIRESATDGSDFTNPAADYRRLFLGEDGLLHLKDSAGSVTDIGSGGSVATDAIWDAAGDLAVGSGADTAARLAIGATNGMAVQRVSGAVAWALPPGFELDYVEKTSSTNITSTTSGTPDTIITSNSVTFDGAAVIIEFFSPGVVPTAVSTNDLTIQLRDDTAGSILGYLGYQVSQAANGGYRPVLLRRRLTPAAGARVYSIRAFIGSAGTGVVLGGAGGSATTALPAYIRITKV